MQGIREQKTVSKENLLNKPSEILSTSISLSLSPKGRGVWACKGSVLPRDARWHTEHSEA